MHNETVFLFGAGISADAGIPLLGGFVDEMWKLGMKGVVGKRPLTAPERELLINANSIRVQLETYQSRANFSGRNIEDLLSILAFESMTSEQKASDYKRLVSAIGLTIDVCCKVPYSERATLVSEQPPPIQHYAQFWNILLQHYRMKLPTLITFNYDLVLERALYFCYHQVNAETMAKLPLAFKCDYHYPRHWIIMKETCHYEPHSKGVRAKWFGNGSSEASFDYLKLHGSLNWSAAGKEETAPTAVVEDPVILPPVFNKMQSNNAALQEVWTTAMKRMQTAKNIVIVGYSLPPTDIYMQYFLKTVVGPNSDLNRIYVFNPVLFKKGPESDAMKARYGNCFSPHLQERIVFQPPDLNIGDSQLGTFAHFLRLLQKPDYEMVF